jgi:hypothetical protein
MLHKECIFNLVHLKQKEGYWLKGAVIIIYINPFIVQQEQVSIILLNKRINVIIWVWRSDAENLIRDIRNES